MQSSSASPNNALNAQGGMSFLGGSFDFSAFQGSSGNGNQGGLSPVNQPDPNYVNYDFSAFNGNATNGSQGGLSPVNQPDPNYVNYDFSAFQGNSANGSQGGLVPVTSGGSPVAMVAIPGMGVGASTGSNPLAGAGGSVV